MACAAVLDAGFARSQRALRREVLRDEGRVARLEQVDGPGHGVSPETVDVLTGGPADDVAGLREQRMGIREVPLGEEVGQDPDHVVTEFHLVAVDAGVEGVGAADELRGDEAALVRVDKGGVGHVDMGDARQLGGPEGAHVRIVTVEAAGGGERLRAGPRRAAGEPVGGDDVVVVDGLVGGHGIGCLVEGHEGGRGPRVDRDGVPGRVGDADAAVHGDEGRPAEDDLVGELGDGDGGTLVAERGHLGREVAAGVGPGRPLALVDAEPVLLEEAAGAVLDHEGAPETGDDAVVVAEPADGRGGPVGTGEGVGVDVEIAAVGRGGAGGAGGRRGGVGGGR